jgi:hypothetical protein
MKNIPHHQESDKLPSAQLRPAEFRIPIFAIANQFGTLWVTDEGIRDIRRFTGAKTLRDVEYYEWLLDEFTELSVTYNGVKILLCLTEDETGRPFLEEPISMQDPPRELSFDKGGISNDTP